MDAWREDDEEAWYPLAEYKTSPKINQTGCAFVAQSLIDLQRCRDQIFLITYVVPIQFALAIFVCLFTCP